MSAQTHMGARILSGRLHDSDSKFLAHAKVIAHKRRQKRKRLGVLEKENLLQCNERWDLQKAREEPASDQEDDEEPGPLFGNPHDIDSDSLVNDYFFTERHDIDEPRCSTKNFVQLAEMLLCFHAFYKSGKFWKVCNKNGPKKLETALRRMMLQLTSTLNRGEGTMNWNIQKIHEILHLPIQMTEYGSPSNFDAGTGESGLKLWAKRPAKRSLKGSIEVFTSSTANRVHEGMVIAKAAKCLGVDVGKKRGMHQLSSSTFSAKLIKDTSHGVLVGKPKYLIKEDGYDITEGTPHVVAEWLSGDSVSLPDAILEIYYEEFFRYCHLKSNFPIIHGYTEYRLSTGEIVRAHPNYGGKGPIYDWVVIKDPANRFDYWKQSLVPQLTDESNSPIYSRIEQTFPHHVPARLIAFFHHPETSMSMAIVHACRPWSAKNYKHTSVITESWNLQVVQEKVWQLDDGTFSVECTTDTDVQVDRLVPMYHSIPTCDIKQGLFVVQEDEILADCWPCNNRTGHILVIHDREEYWADEFISF